jgi:hypothetical protein
MLKNENFLQENKHGLQVILNRLNLFRFQFIFIVNFDRIDFDSIYKNQFFLIFYLSWILIFNFIFN